MLIYICFYLRDCGGFSMHYLRYTFSTVLVILTLCVGCTFAKGTTCFHSYSSDCDKSCNLCGEKRDTTQHTYDNPCDKICNVCNSKRKTMGHLYDNNCDTTCNNCGLTRSSEKHKYTNSCDATCNSCGKKRKATHNYSDVIVKATQSYNGKITGKCTLCGTVEYRNSIYKLTTVKLNKTRFTYTSKTCTPKVIIRDSKSNKISSKYYKVKYPAGRRKIGTYKITVTFKGNYKGKAVLTFKITPKPSNIYSAKPYKTKIKIRYSKTPSISGYKIEYSTLKTFKKSTKITVSNSKSTSNVIENLTRKKKYYIRIRTYKKLKGKTYYSNWSTPMVVMTK